MSRKTPQDDSKKSRLTKTRERIQCAQRALHRSILGPLFAAVFIKECGDTNGEPLIAACDPWQGVLWVNPYRRQELKTAEWTFVLGHMLLHLGLNHAARRMERDPLLWNLACEHGADNLLAAFKIGEAPHDFLPDTSFAGMREEEIYDQLATDKRAMTGFKTYAGTGRADMMKGPGVLISYESRRKRKDYEALLVVGIRNGVENAIVRAADTLGQADDTRLNVWRPLENARKWVMNELPLLGALAAQLRVIADGELCDRMHISIAAVNARLGEIYFHPHRGLTQEEVLFVYVHELLHVALLHHARTQGRDHEIWNFACDFVINGWLIEMGVGKFPSVGGLYDGRLKGMSAEEVYDLLGRDPKKCKGLRGFGGEHGDVLLDERRIFRGDIMTLDDVYRRCLAAGMACQGHGRGLLPAGLLEEIRSLFTPPVPWDVELARWMDAHVPLLRDPLRTFARASRRQGSTPDIPRPARYIPQEWKEACTFGVILDTSGSMDRELLGRALGAIASYAEARDVPAVRLILCDAAPYDRGAVPPTDLRGVFPIQGRGGTVLQPAINFLLGRADFPPKAPVMILTDGWCEEELLCPREHCFVLPRKGESTKGMPLRTSAPLFRVLKEE